MKQIFIGAIAFTILAVVDAARIKQERAEPFGLSRPSGDKPFIANELSKIRSQKKLFAQQETEIPEDPKDIFDKRGLPKQLARLTAKKQLSQQQGVDHKDFFDSVSHSERALA